MEQNLWLYADKSEIDATGINIITFGAEVFKRAKIISELSKFRDLRKALEKKEIAPSHPEIIEYAFENLIDTVRILVFFENYMKAALISKGYCIHKLNKDISGFDKITSQQYLRPISLKEINEIEPFKINQSEKKIEHSALKETTIGLKELLSSKYSIHYNIEKGILEQISQLKIVRNQLHFYGSINFTISDKLILQMEKLNEFVDKTIEKLKTPV